MALCTVYVQEWLVDCDVPHISTRWQCATQHVRNLQVSRRIIIHVSLLAQTASRRRQHFSLMFVCGNKYIFMKKGADYC